MTPMDWLDAFGTNVVHIHAHNNQGQRDDHFAFNRGTLDLEAFLNHVALSRHKLGLVLEVFSMAGIRESYEILLPFLEMQQSEQAVRSFLL
jgi:sugar phosphate isomerase/epimerase